MLALNAEGVAAAWPMEGSVAVQFASSVLILKLCIHESKDQDFLNEKAELERIQQIEKYNLVAGNLGEDLSKPFAHPTRCGLDSMRAYIH